MQLCHCCSQKTYSDCCAPLIEGSTGAQNPEQLMRSRYSAFATGNSQYLIDTTAPSHRDPGDLNTLTQSFSATEWKALKVMDTSLDGEVGYVEFIAFFVSRTNPANKVEQLHERSQFIFIDNRWFYTSGEGLSPIKWQRNDLCYCGSGIKFKKCCAG